MAALSFRKDKVLIVGGDSRLAKNFIEHLRTEGYSVTSTTRNYSSDDNRIRYDLLDEPPRMFDSNFKFAFNFAGIAGNTAVINDPRSKIINIDRTLNLLGYLVQKIPYVYQMSSADVFSGRNRNESAEAKIEPRNIYGCQKAAIEQFSQELKFRIVRVGKVIDFEASLLKDWVLQARRGVHIKTYEDVFISPICIDNFSKILISAMDYEPQRIIQFTSKGDMSYSAIAKKICSHLDLSESLVQSITRNPSLSPDFSSLEIHPKGIEYQVPEVENEIENWISRLRNFI